MESGIARLLVLLLLTLAVFAPRSSSAETATQQARTAYDAGSTEYNLGNFDKALDEFKRAYRLVHDPAFLFNIAQCRHSARRNRAHDADQ